MSLVYWEVLCSQLRANASGMAYIGKMARDTHTHTHMAVRTYFHAHTPTHFPVSSHVVSTSAIERFSLYTPALNESENKDTGFSVCSQYPILVIDNSSHL